MDNDLMARRLRPPSEPPRPQNGHHSPLPIETPPWAVTTDTADVREEVPWDRPQEEPWPPATTDDQPVADVWPPVPAQVYEPPAEVTDPELIEAQPQPETYAEPQSD